MAKPEDLELDQLLYNAVMYLVQTGKQDSAQLLMECDLDGYKQWSIDYYGRGYHDDPDAHNQEPCILVELSAPPEIQSALGSDADAIYTPAEIGPPDNEDGASSELREIGHAFSRILRQSPVIVKTHLKLVTDSPGDWRTQLRELAKGERQTNQGRQFDSPVPRHIWNRLHFRSQAEVKIAEALDRKGVMYFPNCAARLGPVEDRRNKEPDFLVCQNGKWGILQVDGKEFHQKAALDHEWDYQFQLHGVKIVRHFMGIDCMRAPDEVVEKFLDLLERNG